jgi:hypothetical protein
MSSPVKGSVELAVGWLGGAALVDWQPSCVICVPSPP